MSRFYPLILSFTIFSIIFTCAPRASAADVFSASELQQCMLTAINSGAFDNLTIAELRRKCATVAGRQEVAHQAIPAAQPYDTGGAISAPMGTGTATTTVTTPATGALKQRLDSEQQTRFRPFSLTAHKRNYLLPVTYRSTTNGAPFEVDNEEIDHVEVKFQFSFKFPIWNNLIGNADLWGAYTNLSFWQAYNAKHSSPFRETNHEPELFLEFIGTRSFLGFSNTSNRFGIVHQSNGQHGLRSRSWNRIYLDISFERDNLVLNLKPWFRIPESDKQSINDPDGDDNPNIEKYLGYGEISADYKWGNQLVSVMLRNNLRARHNKGAIQIDWTFPLTRRLKGYIQYFNGYGESLIDYNASVNRLGLGIALTDSL